ncbi:unnamed protein product [Orchesella dallaii]|uniref:Uncharacterized protein n=1 Tax=Orchesella dallaii TaxID=48710 RepID=A0ABP1QVM9_9HEXA
MSLKQTIEFADAPEQIETDKIHVQSIVSLFRGDRPRHCPGFKIPSFHGSIPIKVVDGPEFSPTVVDNCAGFIMVKNPKKKKRVTNTLQPDVDFCRERRVPFTRPCPHGDQCDKYVRVKYALALATIRDVVPYNLGSAGDLYHQITLYGWSVTLDLKSELSWTEFLLNPELYPQRRNRFCPPFLLWSPQCLIEFKNTQDVLDDVIIMEALTTPPADKKTTGDLDDGMDEVFLSIPSPPRGGKRIRMADGPPSDDDGMPMRVRVEQNDYRGFPMVRLTRKSINGKQLFFTFAQHRETGRIISALVHLWVERGHNPQEIRDALDTALEYLG